MQTALTHLECPECGRDKEATLEVFRVAAAEVWKGLRVK
jgi:hypothetical protein